MDFICVLVISRNRIEFENPGGLIRGMTPELLTHRSIRRNRLIADLLHRAGYIERVGSGFARIQRSLEENNNPPYEISATNFFNLRFLGRVDSISISMLSPRQRKLFKLIQEYGMITTNIAAIALDVSHDTALNELRILLQADLIDKIGVGKATQYKSK